MIIRKNASHLILLLCLLCFVACKSSEQKAKEKTDEVITESIAYKALASKWGGEAKYDFNADRSMVLAQSIPAPNAKELTIAYFVFDMKTEKVRTEGTVRRGSVNWLTNKEIEVFNTPGKMAPNTTRDNYTVVINVLTGVNTPKTEWNK